MTALTAPPFGSRPPQPPPQAGMGIASFVLGVFTLAGWALLAAVLVSVCRHDPHADDEGTPLSYLVGGWMYGTVVLGLCGLVFGVGGLRQAGRRRSLAVAGLCLNGLVPMATLAFMLFVVTFASNRHDRPAAADEGGGDWGWAALAAFAAVVALACGVRTLARRRAAPAVAPCGRCRQALPSTAQFCRRCGLTRP